MDTRTLAEPVESASELVLLRRALHAEPEIGLHLPRTQERVLAALRDWPLELRAGRGLSSVVAVLRGTRPGPTVLLRADMDALPVTESTALDYASTIPGRMHACGHDLHTAMLVGAARSLCERRDELAGNVVFMFQPGEEGWSGARLMLDEGLLEVAGDGPAAAYALHVRADRPFGVISSRPGSFMSAADNLNVRVIGRGGHASTPQDAADPVPAVCEMVCALQTLVTRRFDAFDPVVVSVGNLHAGSIRNVIPSEGYFEATVRSFSPQARAAVARLAPRLIEGIAAAHDLSVEVTYDYLYPATVNDAAEYEFATATAQELFGAARVVESPTPDPGAEDFSFVLEQVPGAFLFLGACPKGLEPRGVATNHSAEALFDDSVLSDGATLLAELARRRCSAEGG